MASVEAHDDVPTVCAISMLAGILANVLHEGLGHAATALLTGAKSGVLSTVAWSSDFDSRLVAAAGTLANLVAGAALWLALRSWRSASRIRPQSRPVPSFSAKRRKSSNWFSVVCRSEETRNYSASTSHPPNPCGVLRRDAWHVTKKFVAPLPAVYLNLAEERFERFLPIYASR